MRNMMRAAVMLGVVAAGLTLPTAAFANKWAVVSSAGALVRGNGAVGATALSNGTYQVTFNSDMSGCGFAATAGDPGAGAVAGPITSTVALRAGNNNALFIQTWDQTAGTLSNQPFHVTTFCGTKTNFAVVEANGALVRGGHTVSATQLGPGSYEVVFNAQGEELRVRGHDRHLGGRFGAESGAHHHLRQGGEHLGRVRPRR